ncbi:hypothetical protein [Streptomyces sp. NPDC093991]
MKESAHAAITLSHKGLGVLPPWVVIVGLVLFCVWMFAVWRRRNRS